MPAIKFDDVSKKYKLYSKGGLYLRDRITHALQRFNPFNGAQHPAQIAQQSLEKDFWALKNVSFEIKQGESVGFIGRNGAGKSTILKLLAGVTKPSSGKVAVNGKVAALIEVGAGFHPELTGRENIYLNGSILGMKKVELNKQFDSIVTFAELQDFIDTPVKHYSSGMYVRLGFAIAAHTNPDIYLIDEVLAVGDEAFQKKCLDTLASHKAAGKTMILVSHNLDKIAEVCDRVVYIDHGQIGYDGLPLDAIRQYRLDLTVRDSISGSVDEPDAHISELIFRDTTGKMISKLNADNELIIELRYFAKAQVKNPVLGVLIHGPRKEYVASFDTRTSKVLIDSIEGYGSVSWRIKNVPLRNGQYDFSAGLFDGETKRIYDYHDRGYHLKIIGNDIDKFGLVNLREEWISHQTGNIDENDATVSFLKAVDR